MVDAQSSERCPGCSAELDDDSRFCGHCGAPVGIAPTVDPHIGEVVAGRYRIKERLASGGMGEVYVAEHDTLSQRVAVKLLHARYAQDERVVQRFFNEARSYCRVKHPHAVGVLDFGRLKAGTLYIVTEFVAGKSLAEFVHDRGALEPGLSLRLGRHVAEALSAAHAENIVHRDLKPDNVMVTAGPGGRYSAKVLDFGIAKMLDDDEDSRLTQTGAIFGTPEFMSPEQAQGIPVGFSTDIYAFGCLLFFMLTGEAPFKGRDKGELIRRHINEPPPMDLLLRDGDIPAELVTLVQDCMRKEPGDRPGDVLAVLSRLEQIGALVPDSTGPQAKITMNTRDTEVVGGDTVERWQNALELAADSPEPEPTPSESPGARQEPEPATLDASSEPEIDLSAELEGGGSEEFSWSGGVDPDPLTQPLLDVGSDSFSGSHLKSPLFTIGNLLIALVILGGLAAGYIWFVVLPHGSAEASTDAGSDPDTTISSGVSEGSAAAAMNAAPDGPGGAPTLGEEPVAVAVIPIPAAAFSIVGGSVTIGKAASLLESAEVEQAEAAFSDGVNQLAAGDVAAPEALPSGVVGQLAQARDLITRAEEALGDNRCRRADRAIVEMRQISPALRRRFLAPLNECNRRVRNRGVPPRSLE